MKIRYDSEVDALSIVFRDTTVTTRPIGDGITGEYDSDGRLAGLEVLDVKSRFGDEETFRRITVEGIGPVVPVLREPPTKPYEGA